MLRGLYQGQHWGLRRCTTPIKALARIPRHSKRGDYLNDEVDCVRDDDLSNLSGRLIEDQSKVVLDM
jgi:hypothetical protein